MNNYLLQIDNLKVHFPIRGGILRRQVGNVYAVDGVSFRVRAGETLGVVGESGCGKTTAARAIMRLYKPTAGRVVFDGRDLSTLGGRRLRSVRRDMQMIFQDPFESLNSRHTVGEILAEPFIIHRANTGVDQQAEVRRLLNRVGLSPRAQERFPHEFSGGQRQRIGIARAIALEPRLIVCDEPISALDVSIQSQILNLLLELQHEMGLTYVFIAHDLAVVKHISDHIAVMYLGKFMEIAPAQRLYASPAHPYTHALIAAIPIPDPAAVRKRRALVGEVPSPIHPPSGCVFHTRCPYVIDRCRREVPHLEPAPRSNGAEHRVACLRAAEMPALLRQTR